MGDGSRIALRSGGGRDPGQGRVDREQERTGDLVELSPQEGQWAEGRWPRSRGGGRAGGRPSGRTLSLGREYGACEGESPRAGSVVSCPRPRAATAEPLNQTAALQAAVRNEAPLRPGVGRKAGPDRPSACFSAKARRIGIFSLPWGSPAVPAGESSARRRAGEASGQGHVPTKLYLRKAAAGCFQLVSPPPVCVPTTRAVGVGRDVGGFLCRPCTGRSP